MKLFKPVFPKTRRQRKKDRYRTHRSGAREKAYARDGGRCRWPTCRKVLALESDNPWSLANGHEIGGGRGHVDPTDPKKIVTLCNVCHGHLHVRIGGKQKRIEGDDADAPLRYFERLPRADVVDGNEWKEVGPDPITEAA